MSSPNVLSRSSEMRSSVLVTHSWGAQGKGCRQPGGPAGRPGSPGTHGQATLRRTPRTLPESGACVSGSCQPGCQATAWLCNSGEVALDHPCPPPSSVTWAKAQRRAHKGVGRMVHVSSGAGGWSPDSSQWLLHPILEVSWGRACPSALFSCSVRPGGLRGVVSPRFIGASHAKDQWLSINL